MRSAWGVCELVLAIGVSSCSSFGNGDEGPIGGGDASADAAIATDGTVDVTVTDGRDENEGGATDGGRFCTAHPDATVCDDFDDPKVDGQWTQTIVPSGVMGLGMPSRSGSNAIFFTANAGDNVARAQIQRSVPGSSKLTCEYELYVDTLPGANGFGIASVTLTQGTDSKTLKVTSDALKGDVDTAMTPVTAGTWVHHRLTVDRATGTATLDRDGFAVTATTLTTFPTPEMFTILFGVQYLPAGVTKFRVDNVVCDRTP